MSPPSTFWGNLVRTLHPSSGILTISYKTHPWLKWISQINWKAVPCLTTKTEYFFRFYCKIRNEMDPCLMPCKWVFWHRSNGVSAILIVFFKNLQIDQILLKFRIKRLHASCLVNMFSQTALKVQFWLFSFRNLQIDEGLSNLR